MLLECTIISGKLIGKLISLISLIFCDLLSKIGEETSINSSSLTFPLSIAIAAVKIFKVDPNS